MIIMSKYTTISVKEETKKRLTHLMSKKDEYDPFLDKLIEFWEEINEKDMDLICRWLCKADNMFYGEFYTGDKEDKKELKEIRCLLDRLRKYCEKNESCKFVYEQINRAKEKNHE